MASLSSPPSTTSSTSLPPIISSPSCNSLPRDRQPPSSPPRPSASKRFLQTLRIPSFHSGNGTGAASGVTGSGRSISSFVNRGRGGDDRRSETPIIGSEWKGGGLMSRSLSDGNYSKGNGKGSLEVSSSSSPTSSHHLNGGQPLPPPLSPLSLDSFGTTSTTTTRTEKGMVASQFLPVIKTSTRIEIEGLSRDSEEVEEVVETIRASSRLGESVGDSCHTTSYRPPSSSFTTIASSQSKRGSVLDLAWSNKRGAGRMVNDVVATGMIGVSGESSGRRNGAWIVSVGLEPGKKGQRKDEKIEWGKRSVVIYASTPTHQLTFIRSIKELVALHEKLCREGILALPPLPTAIFIDKSTSSLGKKTRRPSFLANFQFRFRSALKVDSKGSRKTSIGEVVKHEESSSSSSPSSHIGEPTPINPIGPFDFERAKGDISTLDLGPSQTLMASPSSIGNTTHATESLIPEISQADAFALQSAMFNDKMATNNTAGPASELVATACTVDPSTSGVTKGIDDLDRARREVITSLSTYLFILANDPYISQTSAWKSFIRIHRDDLVSAHTAERSGEEWVEPDNTGGDFTLKRTTSGDKSAKRKSALRKSKSLTGGMLLGQSWRKSMVNGDGWTPGTSPEVAAKQLSEEQETDDVIRIERVAPEHETKERHKVEMGAPVPTIPAVDSGIGMVQSTASVPLDSQILSEPAVGGIDEKTSKIETALAPSTPPNDSEAETTPVDTPDNSQAVDGVQKRAKRGRSGSKVTVEDFELIRVLGKGCAGKVVLVRHKAHGGLFAMKAIIKRHVIAHSELQHTLTEQSVLKRLSRERGGDPTRNAFIVKLWWSFHDTDNLYLILDFHPGGDLATQLARWGRLGRDRARFYTAEIVDGVECLHVAGVIYRDLKPENVLLGADGHIVLVDFGLAAEFPHSKGPLAALPPWMGGTSSDDETRPKLHRYSTGKEIVVAKRDIATSFVGTAEYLAPEVIKGLPYSYEADWWSLGTMLYEALLGSTPFWVDNHAEMYMRVVHEELTFPDDKALDKDTKSFIRGLLQKDPAFRLCEPRIKKHPYLSMVDFDHVCHKRYIPPYIPPMDDSLEYDIQNFDDTFLAMEPTVKEDATADDEGGAADLETSEKVEPISQDAFDGYTFKDKDIVSVVAEGDEEEEIRDSIDQILRTEGGEATLVPETITPIAPTPAETITPKETTPRRVIQPATSLPINLNRSSFRRSRHSHELSGIDPLDRDYQLNRSVSNATITTSTEDADADDDDDIDIEVGWDIIDQDQQVAANGRKEKDTFFARGVVDRYKLAVLKRRESTVRKASTSRLRISPSRAEFDEGHGGRSSSLGNLKSRFKVRTKVSKAVLPHTNKSGAVIRSNSVSRNSDANPAQGREGSTSDSPGASQHSLITTVMMIPPTNPEAKEVQHPSREPGTSVEGMDGG